MNQLKISFRNFKHSPLLLFINLPGLAIGLAAFLLLVVFLKHETSYDQHFSTKDQVVRLVNTITEDNSKENYAICLRSAYTEIPDEIPEISKACQIFRGWNQTIKKGTDQFQADDLLYVDPEFFDVFGLSLLSGNKQDALLQRNQLVLSESFAQRIFGNMDCMGETVIIEGQNYSIGGVIRDLPLTTHFQFDVLCSMSTIDPNDFGGLEFFTYYLLQDNVDIQQVGEKIATLNDKDINELFKSFNATSQSGIEALTQLHLHSIADWDLSAKGSVGNIILIAALAIFILLIAIINFINLYVFHGEKRLLEIGMRKSFGASLGSLKKLFYLETAILCIIGFVFAFLLSFAILPYFSHLMRVELSLSEIISPMSILLVIFFLFFLILAAGFYPAKYLSSLSIIDAVNGGVKTLKRKKWLTVSSVLFQFFISIFLITSLLILRAQINYMKEIPLGFTVDEVIGISGFDERLGEKAKTIKEELDKLIFVQSVGSSVHRMGGGYSGQVVYKYGESEEEGKSINEYRVQPGFCETMQFDLSAGRFFRDSEEDKMGIVLNESAVEMLGIENPVGQSLFMHLDEPMKIIGVVKDFYYFDNAGQDIQPLCLTAYSELSNIIYLRILGDYSLEKKEAISQVFKDIIPSFQFRSSILKDIYGSKYRSEERLFSLILAGASLAIFLSFIGMFALSVYNVEKKTKEIGLRKVHGSTTLQVLMKVLADILIWVIWAMIPAFLLTYVAMQQVLMNFTNRVSLTPLYFMEGGLIALIIATLAISFKSIQSARQNPMESLRYE